jgi:hypothetical protein
MVRVELPKNLRAGAPYPDATEVGRPSRAPRLSPRRARIA